MKTNTSQDMKPTQPSEWQIWAQNRNLATQASNRLHRVMEGLYDLKDSSLTSGECQDVVDAIVKIEDAILILQQRYNVEGK